MPTLKALLPAALALPLVFAAGGPAAEAELTQKQIVQRALQGTALVLNQQARKGVWLRSGGSGWVVDRARKLLITNHHVADKHEVVGVVFPMFRDGKLVAEFSAYEDRAPVINGNVIDTDPRRDLALVELDFVPAGVAELKLAADSPSAGDRVHSLGNPGASGALWVYSAGTVRAVYRTKIRYEEGQEVDARIIETTAPVNAGDSGGPVLDDRGELVGVTTGHSNQGQLLSWCIDVSEVKPFLTETRALLRASGLADYKKRASYYAAKGRYAQAVADFSAALRLDGKDGALYRARAAAYTEQSEADRAVSDYVQALRLNSRDAAAFRGRGIAFAVKREYDQALADYSEAIRLDPKDASAYNYRGVIHFRTNDLDRAVADYSAAVRLNPRFVLAIRNRAEACEKMGNYEQALADLDELIRLNPAGAAASWNARGDVSVKKGDPEQALADYSEAIRQAPRQAVYYKNRGAVHAKKGDVDKALGDYNQALRLDPKFAAAYSARGDAFRARGEDDRALSDYAASLGLDPRQTGTYLNRAEIRISRGQYPAAVADCTEAIRLDPNNAAAYGTRSRAYEKNGNADKAREDRKKAAQLAPSLKAD